MIKDKFFRMKGKTAKIINVSCSFCGNCVFIYQKDGPGWLKRCYFNRILEPPEYAQKAKEKTLTPASLQNLSCSCGVVLGSPIMYKDGRLAFSLIRGTFKRTLNKSKDYL